MRAARVTGKLAALVAALGANGCTALVADTVNAPLPACTSDTQCARLNERFGTGSDPCTAFRCLRELDRDGVPTPERRVCRRSTGDDDNDGARSAQCGGDDCDDSDPDVKPGSAERCDGVDNDCDGAIDEHASVSGLAGFATPGENINTTDELRDDWSLERRSEGSLLVTVPNGEAEQGTFRIEDLRRPVADYVPVTPEVRRRVHLPSEGGGLTSPLQVTEEQPGLPERSDGSSSVDDLSTAPFSASSGTFLSAYVERLGCGDALASRYQGRLRVALGSAAERLVNVAPPRLSSLGFGAGTTIDPGTGAASCGLRVEGAPGNMFRGASHPVLAIAPQRPGGRDEALVVVRESRPEGRASDTSVEVGVAALGVFASDDTVRNAEEVLSTPQGTNARVGDRTATPQQLGRTRMLGAPAVHTLGAEGFLALFGGVSEGTLELHRATLPGVMLEPVENYMGAPVAPELMQRVRPTPPLTLVRYVVPALPRVATVLALSSAAAPVREGSVDVGVTLLDAANGTAGAARFVVLRVPLDGGTAVTVRGQHTLAERGALAVSTAYAQMLVSPGFRRAGDTTTPPATEEQRDGWVALWVDEAAMLHRGYIARYDAAPVDTAEERAAPVAGPTGMRAIAAHAVPSHPAARDALALVRTAPTSAYLLPLTCAAAPAGR